MNANIATKHRIRFTFTIFMVRWRQWKSVIIFEVDNSSSVHIDGRNKNIIGEGPTQHLNNAAITAEANILYIFAESGKRFLLSMHYNGSNSFLCIC